MTWFYFVYLHPKDEHDRVIRTPKNAGHASNWPERDAFFAGWRANRLREDLIERKWAARVRQWVASQQGAGQGAGNGT